MTHQVQYCPRCDFKNKIRSLGIGPIQQRMECISCGNHWMLVGGQSFEQRASSGHVVEGKVQIDDPVIQTHHDFEEPTPDLPPVKLSKSAIDARVFTNARVDDAVAFGPDGNQKRFHVPLLGSLSAFLAMLMVISQLGVSQIASYAEHEVKIDPISTASISKTKKNIKESMRFSGLSFYKIVRGGKTYISVKGMARNLTSQTIDNPILQIFAKNNEGSTVHNWLHTTIVKKILPGESFKFQSESIALNSGANSISVMLRSAL